VVEEMVEHKTIHLPDHWLPLQTEQMVLVEVVVDLQIPFTV
jgi:hypothetical protein